MMLRAIVLLAAVTTIAGCRTQPAPSAYDLFADRFGPDAATRCERFAYETGRQRFEFQTTFSGEAWAGHNANLAAAAGYERCIGRRPEVEAESRSERSRGPEPELDPRAPDEPDPTAESAFMVRMDQMVIETAALWSETTTLSRLAGSNKT